MAVVFGSFGEAWVFAVQRASETGKRRVIMTHPVHGRFAVQPHDKLGAWLRAGWIVEDGWVEPLSQEAETRCPVCGDPKAAADDTCRWEVCEERFESGCIRCDGNCGGMGECRWDW